jgi:recyclin-1
MDAFITHILEAVRIDAERAQRVFPPGARVILLFSERVANDVLAEYIQPLLAQSRIVSSEMFLRAVAATFVQVWKLVDVVMDVIGQQETTPRTRVEDAM